MMAFFRRYRCPDCGGIFKHLHHPNDSPPPDECELCHASMIGEKPVFVPQAPRIGTQLGKGQDQVYRQMERSSEARMEMMAQHGGGSASDYSHTKITDLHDNQREGEVAAKYSPPPNYVSEFMRLNQGAAQPIGGGYAPMAGATGIEYAAAAHVDPTTGRPAVFHHAGASTRDRVVGSHASIARAVEQEGRLNKK